MEFLGEKVKVAGGWSVFGGGGGGSGEGVEGVEGVGVSLKRLS